MFLEETFVRFRVLLLTLLLLCIAKLDMGFYGATFVIFGLSFFVFLELLFIRQTLIDLYADSISEHKLLLVFLKSKFVNYALSLIVAFYLSLYLFIHVNLISWLEIGFFVFAGLMLSFLLRPVSKVSSGYTKDKPSKVFTRVGLIFIVVTIVVLVDAGYSSLIPIDSRIQESFDENIPLYVVADVEHSYIYIQHLLRTMMFIELNLQSIRLYEDAESWFYVIQFLFQLSPTPYIAYALLFLSFYAIKNIRIKVER